MHQPRCHLARAGRAILLLVAAILPHSLGFAPTSTCVDDDAAVPAFATALGVQVSTCAEVLSMGYCPSVPEDIQHYCCASCAGASYDSRRDSRKGGSRDRGSGDGCSNDDQCLSGACRDWSNFDKRCCPDGHGNRWDQCGNLPSGSACKNWDGSQCQSGWCHDWTCTTGTKQTGESCGVDGECLSGACRDWTNFDKRCCPHGHGNRWDQCGNLPSALRQPVQELGWFPVPERPLSRLDLHKDLQQRQPVRTYRLVLAALLLFPDTEGEL